MSNGLKHNVTGRSGAFGDFKIRTVRLHRQEERDIPRERLRKLMPKNSNTSKMRVWKKHTEGLLLKTQGQSLQKILSMSLQKLSEPSNR